MSETLTKQDEWIKNTLGLDVAAASSGAQSGASAEAPEDEAEDDGDEGEELQKWPFSSKKKQGTGTAEVTPEPVGLPDDKKLRKKLGALTKLLEELKKRGFHTVQMEADGADLASSGAKAEKLTDSTARKKAVAGVKTRIDEAIEHAKALSKSLGSEVGKTGDATAEQKSAVYKKAIEDLYGIKIVVPDGMTNTHFDKMFDMLGSVPKEHVKQLKLKNLEYINQANYGGAYNRGTCTVKMGDFGAATGEEEYEIDGVKMQANSFNVTALHEVGHALDNKEGIMASNRAKTGCGGWAQETIGSVAAGFLKACKDSVTVSDKVTDEMLTPLINTALDAGTTSQPDTIEDEDWKKIVKFLVNNCVKVRDEAQPYFKTKAIVTGDRVFTESSKGNWWSYDHAARAATRVNNYQWRQPAEWFAEVYAISWLKKKKPPSAVDAAVAKFCWNG